MNNDNFFSRNRSRITFILFAAVVIFFGASIKSNRILFHDNLQQQAVDLLTNLGVLVLVLERALELYASIWFRKDRIPLDETVSKTDAMVDLELKRSAVPETADDAKLASVLETRKTAIENLKEYKQKTMTYTLRVSFIAGVIISIAGFRVLDSLFISDNITGLQLLIYTYVDILLTAGILAGGSNGIHSLSTTLGAFFDSSKDKLRNAGRTTNQP
jgi:hypothetical protein